MKIWCNIQVIIYRIYVCVIRSTLNLTKQAIWLLNLNSEITKDSYGNHNNIFLIPKATEYCLYVCLYVRYDLVNGRANRSLTFRIVFFFRSRQCFRPLRRFIYTPNYDKQSYYCRLKLLVKKFGHWFFVQLNQEN